MLNGANKSQGQAMQVLFSLILLLSLMISGLLTIVFGADVYEKINERANENFNSLTALSFVTSKIRQQDSSSSIFVENIEGISVLKIVEDYDGENYETKVYVKDGKLKELFASAESDVELKDGLDIMDLKYMEFKMEKGNLLRVSLTDGQEKTKGKVDEVVLNLRSE